MKIGAAISLIGFHLAKVAFSQEEEPLGYEKRELGRLLADGGVLTEDDKQALLEVHNTYRSNTALGSTGSQPMATDMLEMVWDENLAISSKEHVDKCVFEHSDTGGLYGENIYTAASSIDNVDNIGKLKSGVKKWYDEHAAYDYVGNDCSGVCGHYTQVVWSSSASVGCGYAECGPFSDDLFEVMLVCQYSPPGNYVGEKPYTSTSNSADVASQCPVDFYSDSASGLCKVGSATTNFPTASPTSSPTASPTASPTSSPASSNDWFVYISAFQAKQKERSNGKLKPKLFFAVKNEDKEQAVDAVVHIRAHYFASGSASDMEKEKTCITNTKARCAINLKAYDPNEYYNLTVAAYSIDSELGEYTAENNKKFDGCPLFSGACPEYTVTEITYKNPPSRL